MDAESYLFWLKRTDLESARPADLLEAVRAVMETLQEEARDPELAEFAQSMFDSLDEIREHLDQGSIPLELLKSFRIEYDNDPDTFEAPEEVLENELREIAAGIAEERWNTETYQNFATAIADFLSGGGEETLWSVVDPIEELLNQSEDNYNDTQILAKEVTLESVVVHKLLVEGTALWRQAVDELKESDEPDWEFALESAQQGNRLLVAVQIFNQRVQKALGPS